MKPHKVVIKELSETVENLLKGLRAATTQQLATEWMKQAYQALEACLTELGPHAEKLKKTAIAAED